MPQKSWIGVGYRRRLASSEPTEELVRAACAPLAGRIGLTVVEVRLDTAAAELSRGEPDWSSYDKYVHDLANHEQRVLAVVSPFRDSEGGTGPDNVLDVVTRFCGRYPGPHCIEGVLVDPVVGDGSTIGDHATIMRWIDKSTERSAGCQHYMCIDANLPLDTFPQLLDLLRGASERAVYPYIIRRTASDYADSFAYTRYFAAAARLQRWPFILAATAEQPSVAGAVSAVFGTLSSGATGLMVSSGHLSDPDIAVALTRASTHLESTDPSPQVAVLWPSVKDLADHSTADRFIAIATAVRTVTDYDIVDENRINQDALAEYRVLLLIAGCSYGKATLDRIYQWVREGGILVANCVGTMCCPDGETTFDRDLLDREVAAPNPTAYCTMRRVEKGATMHYDPELAVQQDESISPEDGFVHMAVCVLRRSTLLGADKIEPDALVDGVHMARLKDRILLFNATDRSVTHKVLLPRTTYTPTITLPPLRITELNITDIMAAAAHKK